MAELSDQEMLRYNRQIILRGFDFDGRGAERFSRADSGLAASAVQPRSIWQAPVSVT